jgi:5-methylcytosine-specific restriction endonuclease McrA
MTIIHDDADIAGKICRKCCQWKPLSEYSRRIEHGVPTGDGYQNACKPCRSAAELARYYAKGETAKARLREQYRSHREKRLEAMRVYRSAKHAQILAQKRVHWAANRECINAERREYYAANPEPQRLADREYYLANRQKRLAYAEAYRAAHPDKVRANNQSYRSRFPDKLRAIANRRRARKAQAEGSHTEAEWEALKASYNYTCLCCRRREPDIILTRDHVIALDTGGSDSISNIQPLCKSCNSKKSTKNIDYRPN